MEHLDFVFALDDSSVLQLFDARRTLELRTAALAAQCITDAEIAQLEAILAEWAAAEDDEAREEADREFHKLIAISSRNPILARFVMIVNQLGTESRWRAYGLPTAIDKTMDEHRAIVDALRRHDPKAAEAAMLHHLEHAEVYLRQILLSEE